MTNGSDREAPLTQVEIYGQSYSLRGDGDPAYVHELAAYVDHKMNQIADSTSTVDSLKVAILAALNIADEYHQMKRETEKQRMDLAVRTAELERMLDGALGK
ncbi:MAG TPA: cell division protein ZapA [Candidatus Polarisedimenticolia bacterium]|nr:cell division protein ZapA [Candidatus Polarisedimenticolia bacterium]